MTKVIKIKDVRITLVFKHRFKKSSILNRHNFDKWKIALWFQKYKMVGSRNFKNPSKWNTNLVGSYMLGFEFLIFKAWVEFNKGGMHFEI